MVRRIVTVGDDFTLPSSTKVADANLPTRLGDTALSATYVGRSTVTVADAGPAAEANLIVTGLNRSTAAGASAVIRAEAQAASLLLNNNTGTDLGLTHAYEAVQFTNPPGVTTYGAVKVRLRKLVSTPDAASLTASIYSDVAGAPGVIQVLNNAQTIVFAQSLTTSFTEVEFLLRINGGSPVPYWVVFQTAGLGAGGIVMDSAASGSGAHAHSANGTAWTGTSSKPYLELRGQNIPGIQGTSETYVAVRGDSLSYYGGYFNSTNGVGMHGSSVNGRGIEGISQTGEAGVYGIGSNGFGVKGVGTNAFGIHGSSPNAGGVKGDSVTPYAGVHGTNTQSNGPGVQGDNTGNGDGVWARNTNGTGFGLHCESYFGVTHGWGFTATAAAGLGTTPPALVTTGVNAVRGKITHGTGTTPAAGSAITFAFPGGRPCPTTPVVMLTANNAATAALQPYIAAVSTTGFTIGYVNAPAASQANTVYSISFFVIG